MRATASTDSSGRVSTNWPGTVAEYEQLYENRSRLRPSDRERVEAPLALDTGWHLLAASYDNATARLYVDGVLRGQALSSVKLTANGLPLNLGRANSNINFFGGLLDEVAVYGSALPAARIQAHYDKGKTG